jgi:hypothetical protein
MHRVVILILLLLCLLTIVQAQNSRFECETGERYDSQLVLLPPVITPDEAAQYMVSVIPLDGFQPVIAIEAEGNPTFCNTASEQAALYELMLPDVGEIAPSVNNAQDFVLLPGQNTVHIGEFNDNRGEFMLLVEAVFDAAATSDTHTFTLTLTDAMLNSGVTPTAYLFALMPDFTPSLTITPHKGDSIEAIPVEAPVRIQTVIGMGESAVAAPLPESAGDVQITVDSNGAEGIYALVLHLKTGEPTLDDGIAEVTANEDGSLTLACNGERVSENAMRVTLPDDGETYTVTAVGLASLNPMLAVVDDNGDGLCFDDSEAATTYAAALPTISIDGSLFSAQATVDSTARHVVVGSQDMSSGEFMLVIEGGQVEADDDGDTFGVYITPAMISVSNLLTTYTIALDDTLNPLIAYVNQAGEVITDDTGVSYQCDDAGIPDNCYGQVPSLRDFFVTLADNVTIPALEIDALLQLPINETLTGATFPLRVSASGDTAGSYIVVLHIITQ